MELVLILLSVVTLAHGLFPSPGKSCRREGQLSSHRNCNQFYQCANRVLVALDCPENLLYNQATKQCDWPENVKCRGRIVPDSDSNDSDIHGGDKDEAIVGPQNICAAPNSEGKLVPHKNCNKFYICSNGEPVELACQPYLLYNPASQQCDWPENVKCQSIDYAAEAAVTCSNDGSDGLLLPNEECDKFYMCAAGLPVAYDCPLTLFYNPATNLCDWPKHVECEDRIA